MRTLPVVVLALAAGSYSSAVYAASGRADLATVATTLGIDSGRGINTAITAPKDLALQEGGGNVGIGTTTPASKLQVSGTVTLPSGDINAVQGNDASSWLVLGSDKGSTGGVGGTGSHIVLHGSAQSQNIEFYQNAGQRFVFYATGDAVFTGSLTQNSDARLKTDIRVIPSALDKLALVRGVTFHWKDKDRDQREQMGLIAQDVQSAFPQLVSSDASGTLNVNYQGMVGPLVEAVKDLKTEYDSLRTDFEAYKKAHP